MAKAKDIQYRGNCQRCGRLHAVNGTVALHGYTVEHGWFQGVCNGSNFKPMQIDRAETDRMVANVRADVADLLASAESLKTGKTTPAMAGSGTYEWVKDEKGRTHRVEVMVPYKDAPGYKQDDALNSAIYVLERRAKMGSDFANDMEKLVNSVHGQPLVEVKKAEKPAAIKAGEQRKTENGTIGTVLYQDGARVYWTFIRDDKKIKTWTGSTSWRKMELVKEGE